MAVLLNQSEPQPSRPEEGLRRKRVLQVAYVCDPDLSMESRIGWYRAIHAAQTADVTVLYGDGPAVATLEERAKELGLAGALRFVRVSRGPLGRLLNRTATTYYLGFRLWHRSAYKIAKRLHAERSFDLVHQTTYCGYREPGLTWKLGIPFVWGPVGGTQSFPLAYLGELSFQGAWIEVCRNGINWWQLRFSRRVRQAMDRTTVLIAATQRAKQDIHTALGVSPIVELETAIDGPIGPVRKPRQASEPLNILWAGRLRDWKALPLLLKALPELGKSVDYRVRILGAGPRQSAWKQLAERLGIADRIEWLGWPDYRETLHHYEWAHAFAFTSMRDTSGTGLIEALAAGTPIVGVDHQGAADIMDASCALTVPVGRPSETVRGFSNNLKRLADNSALWHQLSCGARERAHDFTWDSQAVLLHDWYTEALATGALSKGALSEGAMVEVRQQEAALADSLKRLGSHAVVPSP